MSFYNGSNDDEDTHTQPDESTSMKYTVIEFVCYMNIQFTFMDFFFHVCYTHGHIHCNVTNPL